MACLLATMPFCLMLINQRAASTVSESHSQAVGLLRESETRGELDSAHEYNRRLFSDGSTVLGEAVDPWSGSPSSVSEQDDAYQSQLDSPADGIMATISYPRLGIDLPVRHGTSSSVLAAGAGHLYGTSLPVGGNSTHSVISAHSGLADQLMFDRLSLRQGRIGDVFYIKVAGRTLAYKVTSIEVIDPGDFTRFAIVKGHDQVTLLTCTPYGVNNKRLLVTGERASMPVQAPEPKDAPGDDSGIWIIVWIMAVWLASMTAAFKAVCSHIRPGGVRRAVRGQHLMH
ncbi:hypothetical protein BW14_08655 [Bifidobacterium sp. UTBIF-68]|nr:hypothetical protein BW14_08655 [Bifidobacterium sp. UTBIF-68]